MRHGKLSYGLGTVTYVGSPGKMGELRPEEGVRLRLRLLWLLRLRLRLRPRV